MPWVQASRSCARRGPTAAICTAGTGHKGHPKESRHALNLGAAHQARTQGVDFHSCIGMPEISQGFWFRFPLAYSLNYPISGATNTAPLFFCVTRLHAYMRVRLGCVVGKLFRRGVDARLNFQLLTSL